MSRPAMLRRWSRLALLLLIAAVGLGVPGVRAVADIPPPDCDVDCFPPPDPGGGGGITPEGGVATGSSSVVLASPQRTFVQQGFGGVNDVGSAADGSVWIITGSSTSRVEGGALGGPGFFPVGGVRVAVAPNGLPWIVGADGSIRRGNADGSTTLMPGLAHDIGMGGPIGTDGSVWVIGTNSRNGSFQVYQWTGSTWIADPGSGQSIDVDRFGRPVVNGSDNKIWIKDGGANQGWTQLTGRATDMSEGHDDGTHFPGAGDLWIIGQDERPQNSGSGNFGVWTFTAFDATWTLANQTFGARRVAIDLFGSPWAVRSDGTLWRG